MRRRGLTSIGRFSDDRSRLSGHGDSTEPLVLERTPVRRPDGRRCASHRRPPARGRRELDRHRRREFSRCPRAAPCSRKTHDRVPASSEIVGRRRLYPAFFRRFGAVEAAGSATAASVFSRPPDTGSNNAACLLSGTRASLLVNAFFGSGSPRPAQRCASRLPSD